MAERAVADDRYAVAFAPGKHSMLNRSFSQVIQDLIARDAGRANDAPELIEGAYVEIAHTPRQDLPVALKRLESGDRVLQWMWSAPMQQVAVEPVGPEAVERSLASGDGTLNRGVLGQHLRYQKDLVAAAGNRATNQFLGVARTVHLGGVDMRHAEVEAAA